MNKNQRRLAIFSLTLAVMLISLNWTTFFTLASTKNNPTFIAIETSDQKFKEAFTMVHEAEAAGAEIGQIKDFVDRLNLALNLTDETEAATIFDQVKTEASQLRDAASQASLYKKTLTFVMVPVAALTVTLLVHYALKLLRQNKVEKTMKMKIKQKGKTKHV